MAGARRRRPLYVSRGVNLREVGRLGDSAPRFVHRELGVGPLEGFEGRLVGQVQDGGGADRGGQPSEGDLALRLCPSSRSTRA